MDQGYRGVQLVRLSDPLSTLFTPQVTFASRPLTRSRSQEEISAEEEENVVVSDIWRSCPFRNRRSIKSRYTRGANSARSSTTAKTTTSYCRRTARSSEQTRDGSGIRLWLAYARSIGRTRPNS